MKKILYISSIFCLLLTASSCIVDSETSIFEEAEALGFTGSRADIEEFLTTEVLSVMTSLGLDVNPGSTPVDPTGTFLASPYCLAASTDPADEPNCGFANFQISFSNFNLDELTVNYSSVQIDSEGNVIFSESGNGFISGDSNGNFTVIVKALETGGSENATAFSGQITADGIFGYQDIFVPNIASGETLNGRLFNDEDNLAARQ